MKTFKFLIASVFYILSTTARADFNALVAEEQTYRPGTLTYATHVATYQGLLGTTLSQRHVVYVAGFLNEILPFQFLQNIEALKTLGIGAVTRIYPHSTDSINQTAENLSKQLVDLYNNGNENGEGKGLPILLIGHSKGGAEVTMTVVRYPQLINQGIVDKVIGIQSGFSTPLAKLSILGKVCNKVPCGFLEKLLKDGLMSMKTDVSNKNFNDAIMMLKISGLYDMVNKSIFFVRSSQTFKGGLAPVMTATNKYMRKVSGPNDGVVPTKDQMITEIGTDLGVLKADHAALVIHTNPLVYGGLLTHNPFSAGGSPLGDSARAQSIQGFTRALMRSLYLSNN